MRLLLIVNPSASSVTPRTQVLVQRILGRRHEVVLAETSRRNHATQLAVHAAQQQFDAAVVLGGDGTLNEAANGLAGTPTALIALPGGSTNVFVRSLGFADDPVGAARQVASRLDRDPAAAPETPRGLFSQVGVGAVNHRYFLFHAGVGFDAAVVAQVERYGHLKRYLSHPLFVYAAASTWFRHFDRSHPHFQVTVENRPPLDAYFTVVMNTSPYTYLGSQPLDIAPAANLDVPLAVVSLPSMRVDRMARVVGETFGRGRAPAAAIRRDFDITACSIASARPFSYQVDGDYLGEVTELDFSYKPNALWLLR